MGVIAPHPLVDEAVMDDIKGNIVETTLDGLRRENLSYAGFLFIGVMVTPQGARALEYNVRMGDPEAQALLPLFSGSLYAAMEAALNGRLGEISPEWRGGASCCVVMASAGYPAAYASGFPITGLNDAEESGCRVYCAGVAGVPGGGYVTSGGRVLGITGLGANLSEAREAAYRGVSLVRFEGGWCRPDIGSGAAARPNARK
jgi:phosphoribosylamine--glycine ligase